jgi:hypothetical protein
MQYVAYIPQSKQLRDKIYLCIILTTVHVNRWNMLISTDMDTCLKKWTNYEQNKTKLPYTINVTTHRPASTTVITYTGQYTMLLTAVHDAELLDMH